MFLKKGRLGFQLPAPVPGPFCLWRGTFCLNRLGQEKQVPALADVVSRMFSHRQKGCLHQTRWLHSNQSARFEEQQRHQTEGVVPSEFVLPVAPQAVPAGDSARLG